jgi:tRNA-2-methylthio-N6-dimethylallyladenosine synthase
MTSHPRDLNKDLIAAHADEPKLMPFLHLPVQSGSNRILKEMNRGHTAEDYLRLAESIRDARPDIALSSDFIVGFPGETEADFEATLALIRAVGFSQAFSFKYSPRPGTPAAAMRQVPEDIKKARLAMLQVLIEQQQKAFNQSCEGRVLPVLFDKPGKKRGEAVGRSPYLQPVHVEAAEHLMGEVREVRIATTHSNSLKGTLMPSSRSTGAQRIEAVAF